MNRRQTRDSKMSVKKIVGKGIAIGLGIVCIVLVASLVGVMLYYNMQMNTLNNDKDTLTTTYNNYVLNHHHSDFEYDSSQSTVNDLTSSLNLGNSRVWISSKTVSSPYNSYYSWNPLSVEYAGYVSVNVESSTSTHTYVHAIYSAYGVHYDQWMDVGKSGTAVFPVLPTPSMGIYVGAHYEASTVTVTITYYY
jgi:hypothetical protein